MVNWSKCNLNIILTPNSRSNSLGFSFHSSWEWIKPTLLYNNSFIEYAALDLFKNDCNNEILWVIIGYLHTISNNGWAIQTEFILKSIEFDECDWSNGLKKIEPSKIDFIQVFHVIFQTWWLMFSVVWYATLNDMLKCPCLW